MRLPLSLADLAVLRESVCLECKLANGRDGKGALPEDFWPTYSAMANTEGGKVVLGLRERKGQFEPVGIERAQKVRTDKADHPWATLDDKGFLQVLGGWREDRATGESGLTVAGLLMFGQWPAIAEAMPMYFVDYQERPGDYLATVQWLDRLVPDGRWSGNVFDFFRRVVNKLTADIKVPFVLKGPIRQDDTPTHKALREALVNTLVHADYTGRISVLVVKEPAGFTFRNPGDLRVPVAQALRGGVSDCRNRTMQQMFLMIGLGERAGSGMSRIVHGWKEQGHGLQLLERYEPQEHTVLEMHWAAEFSPARLPESSGESSGETGERILVLLSQHPKLTIPAVAQSMGLTARAVEKQVAKLKAHHRLRRVGPNKGGHWEVLP